MRPASLAVNPAPSTNTDDFERDAVAGLSSRPKRLSSKYFYDARGSALFERICEQPEYYLTRVELQLMHDRVDEMAAALGSRVRLIEFGSGAGIKTQLLLSALVEPVAYVPVEISPAALASSTSALAERFPDLAIDPVCADFTAPFELPRSGRAARNVVYFPGSTLGNFDQADALRLMQQMRRLIGADGAVLIGLDLKKSTAELEAAYNDAAGVTADFTLNLLERANRELDANFDLAGFRHRAVYNALAGRIETHIVSLRDQVVQLAGRRFAFASGEAMLVEISCKYSMADVERLAQKSSLSVRRCWSDDAQRFGVFLLEPVGS